MASSRNKSNMSSKCIKWMWNSNTDAFSKSDSPNWCYFTDAENMIIEEAFIAHKTHAMLDDYHIDFKNNMQISNDDVNKQRPVKRKVCDENERILREDRFLPNPVAPDRPFGERYGFISPFIKEAANSLNIRRGELPSKNKSIIPIIVEKAALGIIEEGKKMGKHKEAESIAKKLKDTKNLGMDKVWRCCAYLYTLETFLYKKINEIMRLIGDKEHEQIWKSKIDTLGPYCLLLWDNPFNKKMIQPNTILYRGANVPDHLLALFKDDDSKVEKPWHSFQAFTSCSRNRKVAESFGNVLFIMKTLVAFTVDLSSLSEYPDEEEELLFPGVSFTIDQIDINDKGKNLIYLTLHQRHNKFDMAQIGQASNVLKTKPFNSRLHQGTSLRLDRNDDNAERDGYDDDWD